MFLTVVLCLSLFPATVFAVSTHTLTFTVAEEAEAVIGGYWGLDYDDVADIIGSQQQLSNEYDGDDYVLLLAWITDYDTDNYAFLGWKINDVLYTENTENLMSSSTWFTDAMEDWGEPSYLLVDKAECDKRTYLKFEGALGALLLEGWTTENITIEAVFIPKSVSSFAASIVPDDNGVCSVEQRTTANEYTLTATPNYNYLFGHWEYRESENGTEWGEWAEYEALTAANGTVKLEAHTQFRAHFNKATISKYEGEYEGVARLTTFSAPPYWVGSEPDPWYYEDYSMRGAGSSTFEAFGHSLEQSESQPAYIGEHASLGLPILTTDAPNANANIDYELYFGDDSEPAISGTYEHGLLYKDNVFVFGFYVKEMPDVQSCRLVLSVSKVAWSTEHQWVVESGQPTVFEQTYALSPIDPNPELVNPIQVTVAVEKLTVDGNYLAGGPQQFAVETGTNAAWALMRFLRANYTGIQYIGSPDSGFYLSAIADGSVYSQWLSEKDHGEKSGWMYSVNNTFPSVSAADRILQEGDVIRWQYTCANTDNEIGVDLGLGAGSGMSGGTAAVDKTLLMKKYAEIKAAGAPTIAQYGESYPYALSVLKKLDATQQEVNAAYALLVVTVEANKGQLSNAISAAEALLSLATAGEASGQYPQAAYDSFNTAINTAKDVKALTTATQNQVDTAKTVLEEATTSFASSKHFFIVGEYETVKSLALTRIASVVPSPAVASTYGEWAVIALARGGAMTELIREAYLANLRTYLNTNTGVVINNSSSPKTVVLNTSKPTENERVVLALTSLGIDASNWEGYDLVSPLSDASWVNSQGINSTTFALIALDSKPYEVEGSVRTALVQQIVGTANSESGKIGDSFDYTAMAVQALAGYYNEDAVKTVVDNAMAWLDTQTPVSSESSAQMVVAQSALLQQNSTYVADILRYALPNGSFQHELSGVATQMSTEQAAYALVAYDRLLKGKSPLYTMADAFNTTDPGTDPDPVTLTSLTLTSLPTKATYTAGEEFDPAGLTVQAHFSDSSTTVLAADAYTLSTGAGEFLTELAAGSVLSQAGDITVTVTYTHDGVTQTATFVLTVNPAPAPNAENLAKVQAATEVLTNLASLAQVSQATANDANTVLTWLQTEVEALALDGVGTTISVNVNSAVAGTAGKPSGTNGSFAATLTLSAGAGETLATATLSRTGTILASAYTAPADRIYASISVEKLSLDGTFIIEPALLELAKGATAAEALMALFEATGVNSRYDGLPNRDDFYLRSVGLQGYSGNPSVEGSPHHAGYLSEFDEGLLSGWMITVNNSFIGTSAGARTLADGDVVRWQYTCTPGDVGGSAQGPLGESTLASKDALIQKIAGINFDGTETFYGSAYTDALAVLQDLGATPEAITSSLEALLALETVETPTTPEPGERTLISVAVSGLYRTSYANGEALDLSGLILTAHYSDGSSAPISSWSSDVADGSELNTAGKHFITLSYTEGDVTKTVRISVNVSEFGIAPVLPSPAAVQGALDKTLTYEKQTTSTDAYGYKAEWVVFGLARAGQISPDIRAAYLERLASYTVSVNGSFDRYTDYSRVILALSSLGVDARNFAGFDLSSYLSEHSKVAAQGINGSIFALLALNSGGYGSNADRSYYQGVILASTLSGGGWNLLGSGTADPDVTAMALQALAPYYHSGNAALDAAVDSALAALSALQQTDGGFSSWGSVNSESGAQVIVALNALGIGLDDARFVKDGRTVYDAFIAYQLASGAFEHTQGDGANGMATEQAAYALVSLYRSYAGPSTLYDMRDVSFSSWAGTESGKTPALITAAPEYTGTGTAAYRIDAPLYDFEDVSLGGVSVARSAYTLTSGSTIITFSESYLQSLTPGSHTFTAHFKGGSLDIVLKIAEPSTEQNNTTPGGNVTNNTTTNNYYNGSNGSGGSSSATRLTGNGSAGTESSSASGSAGSTTATDTTSSARTGSSSAQGQTEPADSLTPLAEAASDDLTFRIVVGIVCAVVALGLIAFLIIRMRLKKKGMTDA
jgi:hypothetical protein